MALYVHVPFCLSLCPYCDFVVYAGRAARGPTARVDAFVAALHVELDLRADALRDRFGTRAPGPLGSVYLGGGTPSLLAAADVAALLDHVERRFGIAAGRGDHPRGEPRARRARRPGRASARPA